MAVPGPLALGRSVLVSPGAPVPAAWSDCPVVLVDEKALAEPARVVGDLHAAWSARRPTVVVLGVDPARFRQPLDHPDEAWTLPAGFECWEDRLHFLVWANTYDARAATGPPCWWWGRKALRLGALESSPASGPGDVILPDGRAAWVDGGPRSPLSPSELDGAVLVHAESVERGRLSVAPVPAPPRAELAPDQRAAVEHPAGPARIIAPAGSGKTRVLTERLRHLLVDRGWESDAVLAVAYNKKAQQELDARCAGTGARTRTLNSLGLWLLGMALGRTPEVLDERDTRRLVEGLAPLRRHRANTDPIAPYLEALSQVRLGLVDPAEVEAWRDDVPGLVSVFPAYRAALREAGAVDFDEQIYGAIEALLGHGELRARAQRSCRHLLVDEFQDLTPAHVLLLRLLATPGLDTFGVGDDDQVIYGHAGADPRFLIDYESLWPGAGSHLLEVNYRCPAPVVEAAVQLLSYNDRRVAKIIRPARPAQPGVSELSVSLHSPRSGASSLVSVVAGWRDEGVAPERMAVLTRVNSLLLAPHVALAEAGVPISSVLRPDILERTGLRAALAWLRIAVAPEGSVSSRDLVEVLRRPSRGLPPWFADRLRRRSRWAIKALLDLADSVPDKDAAKVDGLVDDVIALRAAAGLGGGGTGAGGTARLLRVIREDIGLGGAMTLLDQSRGGEGSSHLDDLEALEQVAGLQDDPMAFEVWLRANFEREVDPGGATLSTVHRVKGREWDRVVVYGVTAGLFPHRLAEDVEEERRVLHVAITRGRERVVVLADRGRPSPFLDELDGTAPRRAAVRPPGTTGGGAGPPTGRRARPAASAASVAGRPGDPADPALEAALRAWRSQRSRAAGVPAYVVCSDKTLLAIVAARPASLARLRQVEGIGPTKLELYGEEILALVSAQPAVTE